MLFLKQLSLIMLSICLMEVGFTRVASSQALNPKDIRGETPESRKSISVLHSRFFKKAWRPEVGVMFGYSTDEAYFDTSGLGLRLALFTNEWFGVEVQYIKMSYEESDDYNEIQQLSKLAFEKNSSKPLNIVPEINPITQVIDANIVFAPFYGKLSLSNALTVYSDVYFTLGYARVNTSHDGVKDESFNAITLGIGDRLYFSESFSFRADFRTRMYTEQRRQEDYFKKAYYIDFGVSYFFN